MLAVGIEPDQAPAAVEAALAEAGESPRRTLVVTDALAALGELRALGVGVEHVPAGSRQAELAGGPYEEFLRAPAGADPRRAPPPAGSSWRREGLRYPEGAPMESSTPVKPPRGGAGRRPARPDARHAPARCPT